MSSADQQAAGLPGEPEPFDKGVLPPPIQGRGLVAIDGALALVAILLMVQMWLLTAALESFLAGHLETAAPAAAISGILFAAEFGLCVFVDRIDADVRRSRARSQG
jgi:hypothetical protein